MRKTHHLEQGSEAWLAHRATPGMVNASEVAAIMGLCRHTSRGELLRRKATGIEPEHSATTLRLFAKGHEDEAMARQLAEELIEDDLSALVMTNAIDGLMFSASLDGITQDYGTTFEHKSLNMMLSDSLGAGVIPPEYHPQMEVGLMVSGADGCLFMASKDGDTETARSLVYLPDPLLRNRIIAACKQFQLDLENYQHVEATVAPVAAHVEALPVLAIKVTGEIALTHNIKRFGERLTEYIGSLNTKPETDQDFANLEKAVKVLKEAGEQLDAEEKRALASTEAIAVMRGLVETYRNVVRDNRLMIDKLVSAEKQNRRNDIIRHAQDVMILHIDGLNGRAGGLMPRTIYPFADAIKGLKSIDSMRDKVSAALANAKIKANEIADTIEANRASLTKDGQDWTLLFPDFATVCTKAPDDFAGLFAIRISQHRAAEEKRIEVEREKIRKEESDRITKEAALADAQAKAQAANDQREKADAGVGLPLGGRAQPEAASIPPITARPSHIDQRNIEEFLALLSMTPAEKTALKINLVKFVKYRAAKKAQAADEADVARERMLEAAWETEQ